MHINFKTLIFLHNFSSFYKSHQSHAVYELGSLNWSYRHKSPASYLHFIRLEVFFCSICRVLLLSIGSVVFFLIPIFSKSKKVWIRSWKSSLESDWWCAVKRFFLFTGTSKKCQSKLSFYCRMEARMSTNLLFFFFPSFFSAPIYLQWSSSIIVISDTVSKKAKLSINTFPQ